MMQFLIMAHIVGLLVVTAWMIYVFAKEWKELYSRKK